MNNKLLVLLNQAKNSKQATAAIAQNYQNICEVDIEEGGVSPRGMR